MSAIEFECDALLFDLDGVLVDSGQTIVHYWKLWGDRNGIPLDEILRHAHGRRTAETMRIVAPHLDADAEAAALDGEEAVDLSMLARIDGASDLIASIPDGAWAVATSGTRIMATNRLAFAGVRPPSVLITSEDVTHGKPNPEPYLAAATALGVDPARCIVVEDAPAGIQAGLSAGARVIGVASTHPPTDLTHATITIARLSDITVLASDGAGPTRLTLRVKTV
jgi:sugar-phosphatase